MAPTSWLYGMHGQDFVCTILQLANEKYEVQVVSYEIGSPTSTATVCPMKWLNTMLA